MTLTNEKVRGLLIPIFIIGLTIISRADVVIDWNVIATSAAPAAGKNPIEQSRIYAMTHAAIHDALNAIDRRNKLYAMDRRAETGAAPDAAVATAAHDVLVAQLPTQRATLDAAYTASLASIADGLAKTNGIAIGQAAAAAVLALRSADGSTAPMPYTPGTAPGAYQLTPPNFAPAVLPGWGAVTPFTLRSGAQFRPDPPELFDLTSAEYTRDYNEVKTIGELNSATRTAAQSEIARFWFEGSPTGWNRIARVVAAQQGLDPWQNARLFGLLNFAMADGFIAGFDTKYFYNFWRPVTAIRAGETDNNQATVADPAWAAFIVTPASPDYPSTHSVLGAAAAEVLSRFFGADTISFTTTSGAPFPGITRSYTSFSQAARENADSRVYAGIHFRTACADGLAMGRKVGRHVFKHALQPAFDICLRDDRSGDILRINTASGDYQFLQCGGDGFTLDGKGEVRRVSCVLALVDARVVAVINHCPIASPDRGHAIVRESPRLPMQVFPGALDRGAVGTAFLGRSPDGSGRAVFCVALADGGIIQAHTGKAVDGLAPVGTVSPLINCRRDDEDDDNHRAPPRLGVILNYTPVRTLFVSEPFQNTIAAIDLIDDGVIFRVGAIRRIHSGALNEPIDLAPAEIETEDPNWASNTMLEEGADFYVANRRDNTIVRMRQDGTVVAVRRVRLANGRSLGNGRLNGIAVSPDGSKIWVTVTGHLAGQGNLSGAVLELPAFPE